MKPLPGCEDSSRAALGHNGDGIMGATFAKTEPPQLVSQLGRPNALFSKSYEIISCTHCLYLKFLVHNIILALFSFFVFLFCFCASSWINQADH